MGVAEISTAICARAGIASIHDLHVWSISSGKTSLSVHVVSMDTPSTWPALVASVRDMLASDFSIHHTTVQVESSPCEQSSTLHEFSSSKHASGAPQHDCNTPTGRTSDTGGPVNHQDHLPPDWVIEMSLTIFAVAILVMGVITVLERLRRGAPKIFKGDKTKHRRRKKTKRGKN